MLNFFFLIKKYPHFAFRTLELHLFMLQTSLLSHLTWEGNSVVYNIIYLLFQVCIESRVIRDFKTQSYTGT